MKNKEPEKNTAPQELNDDALADVAGGTGELDYGFSSEIPNSCPKCGKSVHLLAKGMKVELDGMRYFTDEFICTSCDYKYSTDGRLPIGYY